MPKVILLSQIPLPYAKIGSWTTLYHNYLSQNHKIDSLICEKPDFEFANIKYQFIVNNFFLKIIQKAIKNNFLNYQLALNKLIKKDQNYIIQIIDNSGLAVKIHQFLINKKLRKNCYIQFFYDGFLPSQINSNSLGFYENIDKLILLTNLAHQKIKPFLKSDCPKISVLNNGIDNKKFFKINNSEKLDIKNNLGFQNFKIFLRCSQDRPKKGLHIALESWKAIHENNPETVLLVNGCQPREDQKGVVFLGKIPNNDLPKYYHISDVYLFPTLCDEGFGMSLAEALHCGCYCIASAFGGVPEVLNNGKWGVLIENPNNVAYWTTAIQNYLLNKNLKFDFPNNEITSKKWNQNMNIIIQNAKNNFSLRVKND